MYGLKHSSVKLFEVDYNNLSTCEAFAKSINNKIDGIVLIPPRINGVGNSLLIPSAKDWSSILDMLFINPVSCLKMLENKISYNAGIVLISGVSSIDFLPGYANINIARQALALEAKNLAYQLKDKKVRVNTISPGKLFTSFYKKKMTKKDLEKAGKELPGAEDLSYLVSFLLTDRAKYINGQNIIFDNGAHFLNNS